MVAQPASVISPSLRSPTTAPEQGDMYPHSLRGFSSRFWWCFPFIHQENFFENQNYFGESLPSICETCRWYQLFFGANPLVSGTNKVRPQSNRCFGGTFFVVFSFFSPRKHFEKVTRRCRTSIRAPPGAKLGPRQSLKFRDNMRYLDITRTTFVIEATPCQHGRPVPEAAEKSGQPHLG